jgi:flavin-dependent dehydrogenase
LGVLPDMLDAGGFGARGLRFRSPSGTWAQADFPPVNGEPSRSVVIRRYELDHLLLRRAERVPNVTVRQGFCVQEALHEGGAILGVTGHAVDQPDRTETFRAPLTLGCDGMQSMFHNHYGITRKLRRRQRWGVAGHLRGVHDVKPYIEVLFQDDHEVYMAPLANDMVLVAILLEKSAMKRFRGDQCQIYHDFLKADPSLGPRCQESECVPPVGARGPLGFAVEPITLPGLLLVGDSAGFLDPITGEGMTIALKSVQAAVPTINRAFETGDFSGKMLGAYAVERDRIIGDVAKLTQLMLDVTRSRLLTDRAISRLSRDKALFQKLVGIVTGTNRYRDFTMKDRIALGLG